MSQTLVKPIDLGGGIQNAEVRFYADDGRPGGLYYEHPCKDGKLSPGWIPFEGPQAWQLLKLEPLTLSPSLLCRSCGHHGFVREGRWVSA